jgi:formate hydrogenlyase transcriptional activator
MTRHGADPCVQQEHPACQWGARRATRGTTTPPAGGGTHRPALDSAANSEIAGRLRHAGAAHQKSAAIPKHSQPTMGMPHEAQRPMGEHTPLQPERSVVVPVEAPSGGEYRRDGGEAVPFEDFVTALVAVPPEEVHDAIRATMDRLLDPLDLAHCAVFLLSADNQELRLTHHQTRPGMPEPPSRMSRTEYPWTVSRVLEGKMVYVGSLDDVPVDTDRESIRRWAASSFVACPLTIDGVLAGAVCFSSQRSWHWTAGGLERLCLVAHVFGSALGRTRSNAALQSSEQRFQAIADQAPVMIWITGPDKRATWFNRQWLVFVGHTLDEEVGSGRTVSVHPEDLAGCVETYETSFDARRPFSVEYRLRRSDGEWRWVLDNGAPNFAGGEFAGYVGTCLDITEQRAALQEVVRLRDELHLENVTLKRDVKERRGLDTIVGESEAIRSVLAEVERVAATDATVLLLGETGTGKELFAARIHDLSGRRSRTMVRVNCAAIPPTLIESELFGRERGAFTGALARQIGRFELADHSTIFLDEIGDLPVDVQVKLLRVLEERQIERLGNPRPIRVETRIIAGTHRDLEKQVTNGTFREDLFYRLNVFPIHIPPLRERVEDIPLLVWRFVVDISKALGKRIDNIPTQNMHALLQYPWPGNIRELRNVVERSMILAKGPRLTIQVPNAAPPRSVGRSSKLVDMTAWRIRGAGGAAERLGLPPTTLETRIAKLGLVRPKG